MKAIEFPQQTTILAKDQPEYANLPVFISPDSERQMISCHELDDEELELINKTKRIWQSQLTFGQHYHPTWLAVKNPFDVHGSSMQEETSAEKIISKMKELSNEERLTVIAFFCNGCGVFEDDTICQCQNDE